MAAAIPYSKIIHAELADYLHDVQQHITQEELRLSQIAEFSGIYKNCSATYLVMRRLSARQPIVLLTTAAMLVKRSPLLIAMGQLRLACVEIRRLLEATIRYAYFVDHPVEWLEYLANPTSGFVKDDSKPIQWCANREQRWYADYAKERFSTDRSGLIARSLADLATIYRETSGHVHGTIDSGLGIALAEVFEVTESAELRQFQALQRRAYVACVLVALASRPRRISTLTARERGWFDWLLGVNDARLIRGGTFLAE